MIYGIEVNGYAIVSSHIVMGQLNSVTVKDKEFKTMSSCNLPLAMWLLNKVHIQYATDHVKCLQLELFYMDIYVAL